ncbi:shikimate dehydrogenase [Neorhizobium sp. Rsf11]|uniref:shikimate dehydrogenase (NADP(+)) n=2 Tax=Neorhizobium TaxID=1525371 RepID=A0ABV0MBP1_9HYPH|nr:shikimate dehydrogenase [Neorhizobium petrolearium]MCC2609706.1 shikimate dehydrogenase [Neorhizobium petrolearium]WGI69903.1 shikimate dehydrogenase [Neorhizobium petrolearium]
MNSPIVGEGQALHRGFLPPVTGRTRIYGILADPIYHVKTPEVMNALLTSRGVDGVLVPFHVKPDGLKTLVDGLRRMENFGGFIATVPHKTDMLALCDEVTGAARNIGAVNCVRREADGRMVGAMLDGIGFVEALRVANADPAGMSVYLAGAGGASSAIAFALAEAGVVHITVANRTIERAKGLTERLRAAYPALTVDTDADRIANHDLVVNGTSLGMRLNDEPPLDLSRLRGDQLVADAIMEPAMTPLLKAAEAKGCRIFPGKPMLESQIVLMAQHMGALA